MVRGSSINKKLRVGYYFPLEEIETKTQRAETQTKKEAKIFPRSDVALTDGWFEPPLHHATSTWGLITKQPLITSDVAQFIAWNILISGEATALNDRSPANHYILLHTMRFYCIPSASLVHPRHRIKIQ